MKKIVFVLCSVLLVFASLSISVFGVEEKKPIALESAEIVEEDGGWKIIGSDEAGLIYGIGKFLHTAKWSEEDFVPMPPGIIRRPA